ncbi:MAG TPA: VOC family protein [Burkholderiaceae bacterium]|nr:VOC family protein [Burkholderiaceae bacterium]
MRCELDHLVIGCKDLDQGSAWLAGLLGVEAQAGGKHPLMGTHNRLVRLGAGSFLELIAIDPEAPPPARPRWFGLDAPALQARLADAPVLLTWVVRTDRIVEAVTRVPELGQVLAVSRGTLTWRITVPEDGSLQFGGLLPTVIQWDGDLHPAAVLDDKGCELQELALAHPMSAGLVPMFRALRIAGPVDLKPGPKELVAHVRSPKGLVRVS